MSHFFPLRTCCVPECSTDQQDKHPDPFQTSGSGSWSGCWSQYWFKPSRSTVTRCTALLRPSPVSRAGRSSSRWIPDGPQRGRPADRRTRPETDRRRWSERGNEEDHLKKRDEAVQRILQNSSFILSVYSLKHRPAEQTIYHVTQREVNKVQRGSNHRPKPEFTPSEKRKLQNKTSSQTAEKNLSLTWIYQEVSSKLPRRGQVEAAPPQVSEHLVPGVAAQVALPSDWPVGLQKGPGLGAVSQPRPRGAQLDCQRRPREGKAAVQGLQAALQGLICSPSSRPWTWEDQDQNQDC